MQMGIISPLHMYFMHLSKENRLWNTKDLCSPLEKEKHLQLLA
jgi:hypothetical protein